MLQKYKTKREEGFTIIEVLIVLAIAGLILLIVFLAVPALQRNSRNNARNNEASRLSSTVTECLANRNGQQASCDTAAELGLVITGTAPNTTMTDYQQFKTVVVSTTATTGNSTTDPIIRFGVKCNTDGSSASTTGATVRDFAVLYQREPAITRCLGSQ